MQLQRGAVGTRASSLAVRIDVTSQSLILRGLGARRHFFCVRLANRRAKAWRNNDENTRLLSRSVDVMTSFEAIRDKPMCQGLL